MSVDFELLPEEYIVHYYLDDLAVFYQGDDMPTSGPFGLICGYTVSVFDYPQKINLFKSPLHFLLTTYCLNLLNQGIFSYFRSAISEWSQDSLPFMDCRCEHRHGGFYYPGSILRYACESDSICKKNQMDIENATQIYLAFFILNYLPNIISAAPNFSLRKFVELLLQDRNCSEAHPYLLEIVRSFKE